MLTVITRKWSKPMNCSICDQPIEIVASWDKGHNAQPVNDGRCCDTCNANVVVPARIFMFKDQEELERFREEKEELEKFRAEKAAMNDMSCIRLNCGRLVHEEIENYQCRMKRNGVVQQFTIARLPVLKCTQCGDEYFTHVTEGCMEEALKKHLEQGEGNGNQVYDRSN